MKKQKGKTISIYIRPETIPHYEALSRIAEEQGISLSSILDTAIRQIYCQARAKVAISAGAYLSLSRRDLKSLHTGTRDDGTIELMLDPDYKKIQEQEEACGIFPGIYGMGKSVEYAVGPALLAGALEPDEAAGTGKTS